MRTESKEDKPFRKGKWEDGCYIETYDDDDISKEYFIGDYEINPQFEPS